ncbi:MAG: CDP-alcohol phosphatidyltransferase family protein [Haloarculaceae archaeon]
MTLDRLRPLAERAIEPSVSLAKRLGLTPNAVSTLAVGLAGVAAVAFYLAPQRGARWLYLVGAGAVLLNGWFDLVDGALARAVGTGGPAGDLIDHVLDRYADVAIIAGLAAGVEQFALGFGAVTGVLLTSYLGTQAQAVDLDRVYGGLVGRADRLALTVVAGLVAGVTAATYAGLTAVGWLLAFFAVVGHVTALQRFYHALKALRAEP